MRSPSLASLASLAVVSFLAGCGNQASTSNLDGVWDVTATEGLSEGEVKVSSGKVTAVLYDEPARSDMAASASGGSETVRPAASTPGICPDCRRRLELAFTFENGVLSGSAEEIRPRSRTVTTCTGQGCATTNADPAPACPELRRERIAIAGKRTSGEGGGTLDLKGTWDVQVGDEEEPLHFEFGDASMTLTIKNGRKTKNLVTGTVADSTVSLAGDDINVTAKRR